VVATSPIEVPQSPGSRLRPTPGQRACFARDCERVARRCRRCCVGRVGRALPRPPRAPALRGEAVTPPIDRALPRFHASGHDSTRSAPPLAAAVGHRRPRRRYHQRIPARARRQVSRAPSLATCSSPNSRPSGSSARRSSGPSAPDHRVRTIAGPTVVRRCRAPRRLANFVSKSPVLSGQRSELRGKRTSRLGQPRRTVWPDESRGFHVFSPVFVEARAVPKAGLWADRPAARRAQIRRVVCSARLIG
jgi:hypothetical protein